MLHANTSADFLLVDYASKSGRTLLRWPAPEIGGNPKTGEGQRPATTSSDVWQYGLFLYELFTDAKIPYSNHWNSEDVMLQALTRLHADDPLPRPQGCSTEIYDVMVACWSQRPEERPGLQPLCEMIISLLDPGNSVPEEFGDLDSLDLE